MSRAYYDIAFTPVVRELQVRHGSRAGYARAERTTNRRDQLTEHETEFIRERDGFYQATVGETGWPYVQYRGGLPGFLAVLDSKTVAYADFAGNAQYISAGNLTHDDRIAIFLMDYAEQRRLKLFGRARLVDQSEDPALIKTLQGNDGSSRAERAVVIRVEGYDWNCSQHITPRYTEQEIATVVDELRRQLRDSKLELEELRRAQSSP